MQVDSANAGTNYGAVLENHEAYGGVYNNISVIQLTAPLTLKQGVQSAPRKMPYSRLPER